MEIRRVMSFVRLPGMWVDTHRTPRAALRVPALLALLVACAPEETPAPRTSGTAAQDTAATASAPEPATPLPQDTSWTAGETSIERTVAGAALLGSVRTARHDGFDRIVLDFGDSALPSYRIAYVDRPVRQCGSGEAVPLAGDAWLSITLSPANAHTEAGEPTVREREQLPGLPVLLELKLICDFEAQVEWVAGVRSPNRYRVLELDAPTRLVVDIRH